MADLERSPAGSVAFCMVLKTEAHDTGIRGLDLNSRTFPDVMRLDIVV